MMGSKIVKLSVWMLILVLITLPVSGTTNQEFHDGFEDGSFLDSWRIAGKDSGAWAKVVEDAGENDNRVKEGDMSLKVHIGRTTRGDIRLERNISRFKGFSKNLSLWIYPERKYAKAAIALVDDGDSMKTTFRAFGGLKYNTPWNGGLNRGKFGGGFGNKWYSVNMRVQPSRNRSKVRIESENGNEWSSDWMKSSAGFDILKIFGGDYHGNKDFYIDDVRIEASGKRTVTSEGLPDPAPNRSVLVTSPDWKNALAASTVQKPFLVTSDYGRKFNEFVNRTNPKKIYALGDIGGTTGQNVTEVELDHLIPVFHPNSTMAVLANPGDRAQASKAVQYAYRKSLPVTFDKEGARGMDVLELSEEELDRKYLDEVSEERSVTHLVLADLDSPSSALAPRYSAERDAYLTVREGGSVESFRNGLKNSLERLADRGQATDPMRYMQRGMYLTLFGAPRKKVQDPVDEISLISGNSTDGSSFPTDTAYTDINQDGRIDFSYGRMPRSVEKASKLINTDKTGGALVAGEYGKSAWPLVLINKGGGMWSAKKMRSVFRGQGLNTTFLAERRVKGNMTSQVLTQLPFHVFGFPSPDNAVKAVEDIKNQLIDGKFSESLNTLVSNSPSLAKLAATKSDKIAKYTGGLASSPAIKNVFGKTSLALFRAMAVKDVTRLVQTYMENDIDPKQKTLERLATRETLKHPVKFFERAIKTSLEPYPELNSSSISKRAPSAAKIYFTGESNSTHWILPNRHGDSIEVSKDSLFNQYNGTNGYKPSKISGFVYDGSDQSGSPGGIYEQVLSEGAEGLLGFTADTYLPYSNYVGRNFFRKGFTRGKAFRRSINSFKELKWTFDPGSLLKASADSISPTSFGSPVQDAYDTARNAYDEFKAKRTKTVKSSVMYGSPDEKKDPAVEDKETPSKSCGKGYCNYTWILDTNYRTFKGHLLMDKDLKTLNIPRLPTMFFHKVDRVFPANTTLNVTAEVLNTSLVEGGMGIEAKIPGKLVQKDVYTLLDGRKKLVLKHMALQYTENGKKVFDRIKLTVRAEQDLHAEVSSKQVPNSTVERVTAKVYSAVNATGELALTVANQTWRTARTITANFTAGSNSFSQEFDLEPGRYRTSLVVDSEERLGPIERTFEVKAPAEPAVSLEVPDKIEEGNRFEAVVTASNQGGLPTEITARIERSEAVQPDFFESNNLVFNLSGGETVEREIDMRAYVPGNRSITVASSAGNDSEDFNVKSGSLVRRLVSSVKYVFSDKHWFEDFEAESRSNSLTLTLDRPHSFLKVDKSPGKSVYYLYKSGKGVRSVETPDSMKTVLETPEGKAKIVQGREGRKAEKIGNVSIDAVERLEKVLKRETRRLIKRYYWERDSSPQYSRFLKVLEQWV